ncbi:hypothetical protein H8D36_03310 [archaeon]|nr:hypothetical protein [archaeon]
MKKYRKKPVIIEAFQMTKKRGSNNSEWPNWLHLAWNKESEEEGSLHLKTIEPRIMEITTLEGNHIVTWNDYIIQGVDGEIYPCKPGIFEMTYELVQ